MASQTHSATPPTSPARDFTNLPCPRCGEMDCVSLDLGTLDLLICRACDAELSLRDNIRPMVAQWSAVLAWVDVAPVSH